MMPKPINREDRKSELYIKDEVKRLAGYTKMLGMQRMQGFAPGLKNVNWLQMIKESVQNIIDEINEIEKRNEKAEHLS